MSEATTAIPTVAETEAEREAVRRRMRCVASDAERDPCRVAAGHVAAWLELRRRRETLMDERERCEELALECDARVEGYLAELRVVLDQGAKIRKYVKLVRETNRLDRSKRIFLRRKLRESRISSAYATDLRTFVRGFEAEAKRLRLLPRTADEQLAALDRAIRLEERAWDDFAEARAGRDVVLAALHDRLDRLDRLLADMRADDNARRLLRVQAEIDALEAELAASAAEAEPSDSREEAVA